ncbi:MAG: L-aspartate oxidase [Candidatus Tectomicrobia bacterium]|uniref:L-aspartate oxidase n=1 Tax=Tectimicrobiota bacterium TaxID=2528274 RepID=A0A933GKG5_UNCTE|nr:L-aspartate oxidase [Candidatus Tectomicrobia bacterium]
MQINTDFLVVGSGVAGLSFALKAANLGEVLLITKQEPIESSTRYAQGGIASVLSEEDSYELHIQDTLKAGAGLCKEDVVKVLVESGPACIGELINLGARFTLKDEENLDLHREGGHSKRRIVHAADLTGLEVERALLEQVTQNNNITVLKNHLAIDLITKAKLDHAVTAGSQTDRCLGVYALSIKESIIKTILAKTVILATGGAGKVYLYTSNPDIATGDGIAMAYRAGAKIANMEFIQFHPTCLYHPEAKSFLISEAVRGEGGILKLSNGETFMEKYHPLASLAPRDIVARAIDHEMKKRGDECVYLDISHLEDYIIRERFPNIYKTCLSFGFDMTKEPIPVVPAAHYTCGGVLTDLEAKTNIPGLYALGEVACTGVHGANRLASNSLLEALVFAERAYQSCRKEILDFSPIKSEIPSWNVGKAVNSDESVVVAHNWDEIRRLMWNYVGIVRSNNRLYRARRRVALLQEEIKEYYWDFIITSDLIELRNIALVAQVIIDSAISRRESRGLHYNLDYPERDDKDWLHDTILQKSQEEI